MTLLTMKVNILKADNTWTNGVIIKGQHFKDAVKRLRAYLNSIHAEIPCAIVPQECGDHVLGTETETCANCFAAIAFRRY